MEVNQEVGRGLLKLAEEWSGLELELSTVYGPRRYRRDARLALHVDRLSTHVISVIINLEQQVDSPWLLDILDNQDQAHQVELEPGQMLLYESGMAPHSTSYSNEKTNLLISALK